MRIIKIEDNENGGHQNQTINGTIKIPNGWALVPDGMELERFPYGDIDVEEVDGVPTVTKWNPRALPDVEDEPAPINPIEQLRADIDYISIMTGVEL